MDPVLYQTRSTPFAVRRRRRKRERAERTRSRFELWAWTELPAYRLGLLLGYAGAVYFGISCFIAGVPAFDITAPEGWTPIWSSIITLAGPVGIIGIVKDTPRFHRIEIWASSAISLTLGTYAFSILVLAYGHGDVNRAAAGSGFVWLGGYTVIRTFLLVAKIALDRRKKQDLLRAED